MIGVGEIVLWIGVFLALSIFGKKAFMKIVKDIFSAKREIQQEITDDAKKVKA